VPIFFPAAETFPRFNKNLVIKRPKARYKKSSKTTEKETKKMEGEKNTFFCHEPRWTFWGKNIFGFFYFPCYKRRKRDKINQGKDQKKVGWWVDGSGIQQMHGGVRRFFFLAAPRGQWAMRCRHIKTRSPKPIKHGDRK
jgi:hypothetical protein